MGFWDDLPFELDLSVGYNTEGGATGNMSGLANSWREGIAERTLDLSERQYDLEVQKFNADRLAAFRNYKLNVQATRSNTSRAISEARRTDMSDPAYINEQQLKMQQELDRYNLAQLAESLGIPDPETASRHDVVTKQREDALAWTRIKSDFMNNLAVRSIFQKPEDLFNWLKFVGDQEKEGEKRTKYLLIEAARIFGGDHEKLLEKIFNGGVPGYVGPPSVGEVEEVLPNSETEPQSPDFVGPPKPSRPGATHTRVGNKITDPETGKTFKFGSYEDIKRRWSKVPIFSADNIGNLPTSHPDLEVSQELADHLEQSGVQGFKSLQAWADANTPHPLKGTLMEGWGPAVVTAAMQGIRARTNAGIRIYNQAMRAAYGAQLEIRAAQEANQGSHMIPILQMTNEAHQNYAEAMRQLSQLPEYVNSVTDSMQLINDNWENEAEEEGLKANPDFNEMFKSMIGKIFGGDENMLKAAENPHLLIDDGSGEPNPLTDGFDGVILQTTLVAMYRDLASRVRILNQKVENGPNSLNLGDKVRLRNAFEMMQRLQPMIQNTADALGSSEYIEYFFSDMAKLVLYDYLFEEMRGDYGTSPEQNAFTDPKAPLAPAGAAPGG